MRNQAYEIRTVKRGEKGYPERLLPYEDMPEILYYRGNLPENDKPSASVVGARACSTYGRIQAFRFAKELSLHGIQVISGLASGIDSEGHKGAMEGKTPTFAVLGCGPDVVYPRENRELTDRILRTGGGILSEYPPGEKPAGWHFPARNRIISALSDLVMVVEAREKSGSLITAEHALEQGKTVYALPGAVNDELSRGCHKLIYDGAGIAYCPEAVLAEWGIHPEEPGQNEENNPGLSPDVNLLYSCLGSRPSNLDSLVRKTGLPRSKVSIFIVELCMRGFAREIGRQYYIRQ